MQRVVRTGFILGRDDGIPGFSRAQNEKIPRPRTQKFCGVQCTNAKITKIKLICFSSN